LKYWEKKKKRIFIALLGFGLAQPAAGSPPLRPASHARPTLLSPHFRLGRAQRAAADPARASARLPFSAVADIAGPRVRDALFLPTPASDFLSLFTTDRIRAPIFPLPFLEPLPGYISRVPHPSASISSSRSCCGA
jgi:hypothetical protein